MESCAVMADLNRHEIKESRVFNAHKKDFIYEVLMVSGKELADYTGMPIAQAEAITSMYKALPMKNGERPIILSRVECLAWDLIDTITNSDIIQDAANDYALKLGE